MINQFFLFRNKGTRPVTSTFLSGNLQRYSVSLNYSKRNFFSSTKGKKIQNLDATRKNGVDNSKCPLFKENGVTEHVSETNSAGTCNHAGAIMPGLIIFQIKDDLILKTVNINYF
jgi:hypothetical protein